MADRMPIIILLLLALAPLASGPVEPWALALVETVGLGLMLLYLVAVGRRKASLHPVPGLLPLALLAGLMLVQLVPLPPLLLRLLSPQTWRLYAETVWVVQPGSWMPISVAPEAGVAELCRLAAYAAIYIVTVQVFAHRERLKGGIGFLGAFAGIFALAGILLYAFSGGRMLWFFGEWPARFSGFLATYADENHFAGLLAMLLPLVLALFLLHRPLVSYASLREKAIDFLHRPRSHPHVFFGLVFVLVTAAIFLSLSWGGILGGLGGLVAFILLLLAHGGHRRGVFWALFMTSLALVVGFLGVGSFLEHSEGVASRDGRLPVARRAVWQDSLQMVADFPVLGTGFGTFAEIYPRYKTVRTGPTDIEHAHNDYLEFWVEGGMAGLVLAAWFVVSVLGTAVANWWRRRSRTAIYLCLGPLAGLGALLLHLWTDFALHVGPIGLYFFVFCGLAVAATRIRSRRNPGPEPIVVPPTKRRRIVVAVGVVLFFNVFFNAGLLAGRAQVAGLADSDGVPFPGAGKGEIRQRSARAVRMAPLNPHYRYNLGDASLARGKVQEALDHFTGALRLNPTNSQCLERLGLIFANLEQDLKAESLLRAAVKNDQSDAERHRAYAFWLLAEGKVEAGLEQIRRAVYWGPEKTREFLTLMAMHGLSEEAMRRGLPERSAPLLAYGDYLAEAGKAEAAEESYRNAVLYATREEHPSPDLFQRVADYFAERGQYSEALDVIQYGIERFPYDAAFRRSAGLFYEKLGITYRAVEEYRHSLMLEAGDDRARERLKRLSGQGF